ncbi:pilus assembly PilX N-terminal domain-containing protein [Planctomycetota bacterium]
MTPRRKSAFRKRRASVLVISMIFILVFSALAVSMAAMSGTNVQLASNQHKVGCALGSASSGLEVQRYWLNRVVFPSAISPANYQSTIIGFVQNDLASNCISNITLNSDGSMDPVILDSSTGQTFIAQFSIDAFNPNILQVSTTGGNAPVTRTIQVGFDIGPYEHPIFNYGLATKGPLNYSGNPTTTGANDNWEADIYIESSGSLTALSVSGNTNFDGDIQVGNPAAAVDFQGDVQIAGETGQDAIDNHVSIGADPVDFPAPDTARFQPYATGDLIDSSTDLSTNNILVNCRIAAGTNPTFPKSVILQGILFIESPNVVTFTRNVALEGLIVAEGDLANPGTDKIDFLGNFASGPYPEGMEFDAIRQEEGSSIIAPGFAATFAGNFSALEGVVAVSGAYFTGNCAAQIKGTIINYSEDPMVIDGNASMSFDRESSTKIPAGFDTHRVLKCNPSTYSEVNL